MYRYRCPCSFNTMPQHINRSDWCMVTSQSLGSHRLDVFYWFTIDYTIEEAPVCDAASRGNCRHGLQAVSPYCCKPRRTVRVDISCFASDPNSRLNAGDVAAQSIKACLLGC
ncbi:hypothetical protein TNCV_553931 [Trichonephila clavipes]|nr:hypothetical protein TNCV_553931 [Trichonephila clavipes]